MALIRHLLPEERFIIMDTSDIETGVVLSQVQECNSLLQQDPVQG
jgi:hypothetical protein